MSTVDDFLVGWICTIPTEWVVARAFFDQEYALKVDQPKIKNSYALGRIGKHNVVISSLPSGEYGKSTVSRVAEETMYTFPNLRIALLVGIGGGVPSGMHDIRLGDIAVGSSLGHEGGVYQYNYRRAIRDGRDFQPTAVLEPPPSFIQKAVASLRTSYRSEGHNLENLIDEAFAKVPWMYKKYNRPAPVSDRLYRSNIVHRYPEELCDIRCGDDPSKLISRISRPEYNSQRIHHGVIASSTELMKDAILRDELIGRRDILCFETAASDLMPHFPCLVIRGICDYADSHANDEWHGYAAMVAAAYTKNLLYRIDPNMLAKQSTLANIMDGETDINYRESSPTPAVTFSGHQSSAIQIGQVSGQSLSTITGAQHSDLDPAFQRLSLSPSGDASRVSIIQASSPSQHIPGQHEQQIPTPRTSSSSDSSSRKDQLTKPTARPFRKMNLNSTSHGNGFLVEALYSIGYSRKDVLDLISEKERDSPWIPFEPVDPLPVDIKVGHHIDQCSHRRCALNHLTSVKNQNTLSPKLPTTLGSTNSEELIERIVELCGLAGIVPSTKELNEWAGCCEFWDGHTVARCHLFEHHLLSVLGRVRSAIGLMQQNGLCCDSFTILRTHSPTQSIKGPFIQVVRIPFQLIENLNQALGTARADPSTRYNILVTSEDILRLVSPNITNIAYDRNDDGIRCSLSALAIQLLSIGLLSYIQAHVGPLRPFFLDTAIQEIHMLGISGGKPIQGLIAKLVNLTCFGKMSRGAVLSFEDPPTSIWNRMFTAGSQRNSSGPLDLHGHVVDILDTWGPGNLVFRAHGTEPPVAIKIGDGFIFQNETDTKFHSAHELKEPLQPIDISQPLLIGAMVVTNTNCKLSEAECRTASASVLEYLGASRSSWKRSQRQISLQGGQYVTGQIAETWNKQRGVPIKDIALSNFQSDLIGYLNEYWGLQVSYCTGVARRVPLRKLVADLTPQFSDDALIRWDIEKKLKDDGISLHEIQLWLRTVGSQHRTRILETIEKILQSLRHTGLDATEKYFCIGWPWDGDTSRCLQVPLEGQSSWARMLADSHDCATFAYITMECFETRNIRCRCFDPQQVYRDHILLLETAVVCPTKSPQTWRLNDGEVYFFSKLDSIFWVKVERELAAQTSGLIELAALISLPYDIKQRLYISERRKQRARLRERSTSLMQGEVVSVFSVRKDPHT